MQSRCISDLKMDFPPRRNNFGMRQHQSQPQFNLLTYAVIIYIVVGVTRSIDHSSVAALAYIKTNAATFDRIKSKSSNRSRKRLFPDISLAQAKQSLGREPEDNEFKQKIRSWITPKLPPPPEDQISLSGDVATIFTYSFLDHMVSGMYDSTINSPEIFSAGSALGTIESSSAASADFTGYDSAGGGLPVWFDTLNSAPFGTVPLSAALPIEQHTAYAPAFGTAGLSAVLLTSTWLFCGYFTGAFQFKNTLQCSTRHAMKITAKNWFFTAIVMISLALGSDHFVGCVDCLHKSIGLTKADTAYIFDSLSVLLFWRFITSSLLGYDDGKDS